MSINRLNDFRLQVLVAQVPPSIVGRWSAVPPGPERGHLSDAIPLSTDVKSSVRRTPSARIEISKDSDRNKSSEHDAVTTVSERLLCVGVRANENTSSPLAKRPSMIVWERDGCA